METSEIGAPPSSQAMTDERHASMARDLVLEMMSCVPPDTIDGLKWWPRAKSALETACGKADTWGELVTIMAAKLEIDVLKLASVSSVCSMRLSQRELRDFNRVVKREAVYIIAEAQSVREQQRTADAPAKAKQRSQPEPVIIPINVNQEPNE